MQAFDLGSEAEFGVGGGLRNKRETEGGNSETRGKQRENEFDVKEILNSSFLRALLSSFMTQRYGDNLFWN